MSQPKLVPSRFVSLLKTRWEWFVALLLAVAAFFAHESYGMAWDDSMHSVYGSYVLDYFLSGFRDMKWRTDIGGLYYYGTIFDLPSAAIHRALGVGLFEWRPFLMALSGILAVPAVAGIGRHFGGERTAALSVAALVLMPQFVGQSFINCKDIPLASAVAWSVLSILRATERPGWRTFLFCGLIFGITLGIRIGGVLVVVFAVATCGFMALQSCLRRSIVADIKFCWRSKLHWFAIGAGLLTWAIVVAVWPFAHEDPIGNMLKSFQQSAAFPEPYPVLYLGQVFESTKLPWHYLPLMLFLTMPIPVAALVGLGLVATVAALASAWVSRPAAQRFLLLFWIAFPVAYVIAKQPNIYDGVRHFLFLLPAFAVLGGIGAVHLAGLLDRFVRPLGTVAVSVFLLCALPAVIGMHPYQYAFYNRFAGEKRTLHERFETDYWLTSYREAAGILNRRQMLAARPLAVAVGANGYSVHCFSDFSDKRIRVAYFLGATGAAPFPTEMDFTVAVPRYGMWRNFADAPVAAEIRRNGVLMAVIRSRDGKTAH